MTEEITRAVAFIDASRAYHEKMRDLPGQYRGLAGRAQAVLDELQKVRDELVHIGNGQADLFSAGQEGGAAPAEGARHG